MKQRALTVIAFIGSFAWSLAFSQAPPQEAKQSTIGYASVAEALVALQANQKIQVTVQNGWTIATDQENKTLWSNPALQFREDYDVTTGLTSNDVNAFFGQNVNAMDRLAKAFARQIITSILENF